MEHNIQSTSKRGGGRHHPTSTNAQRRIAQITNRHECNTQRMRFELIFELKALEEMAQQHAIDTIEPDAKRDWMRLAAYISQVINSISKTYDEASINSELKVLQKRIDELSQTKQEVHP